VRFSDEAVLRMLVAVLLGAAIGLEREATDQPAGLRTHIAVCLGAAIFGVVSTLGFDEFRAERSATNIQIDVTRVASQVVVGIGFLGAGVIFRQGGAVRNLTTAASLWVTSSIGLTAGVGDLGSAAAATAVLVVVLVALLPLRSVVRRRLRRTTREVAIRIAADGDLQGVIRGVRSLEGVEVVETTPGKAEGRATLRVKLRGAPGVDVDERLAVIAARPDVTDLHGEVDFGDIA
jgi:putative Mg2+ transporter-C (MgtC) family protein